MKITITMDVPSWTDDEANYWLDYLLEEVSNMNAGTGDDARITNFIADGKELMLAYEGDDYELGGEG